MNFYSLEIFLHDHMNVLTFKRGMPEKGLSKLPATFYDIRSKQRHVIQIGGPFGRALCGHTPLKRYWQLYLVE
jgi:hypothetical protein